MTTKKKLLILTLALLLLFPLLLACAGSTYSQGVDTRATMEIKETIRAAKNEALGIATLTPVP